MRILLLLLAVLLLLAPVLAGATTPNLLVNGAFAGTPGGLPEHWSPLPAGNNTTTHLALLAQDGETVVQVVDHDTGVGVGLSQRVPGQPGHQYAFSAETNGGTLCLYLRFFAADGKMIAPEHSMMAPRRATWQRSTLRETAPPGTATVNAWIYSTTTMLTETLVRRAELHDEGTPALIQGPLTSDGQYFAALNLDFPGLEAVKQAVARADYPAAAAAYLAFRRTQSLARWRVDPAAKPARAAATTDAAGDRVLQHQIAMPWGNDRQPYFVGAKIDWSFNPLPPTDPAFTKEWTYIALNRSYSWRILADAYWTTLDEKYAREWVAELEDWVRDNPVPLEAGYGDTLTWRSLEAGIRMGDVWPDVYYHFLASPAFTAQAHLTYAKSALEHAQRLQRILHDYPEHSGNWVTMECNGLCTAGVLFPEWKDAHVFVTDAFTRLDRELSAQVYPDGGQVELSPMYHQTALANFAGLVSVAALNHAPIPPDYQGKLKAMYTWETRLADQRGTLPPSNDQTDPVHIMHVMQDAAKIWDDPEFTYFATQGKQGTPPPASGFLPYSGYFALRGGWRPDDLYLFFKAGPVGMGHWHEDMLSLYLRAFDKTLLTVAGGYAYDQSPMRRYVLSTPAHNTITVDGKEQHRGTGAKPPMTPCDAKWCPSPLCDYAAGAYAAGYQATKYVAREYQPVRFVGARDTSITHTRHVFFLKPGYVVAVDLLTGLGTHRYDAYFHLDAPDAVLDPATGVVQTQRADGVQLGLYPLAGDGLQARKAIGQQDPLLGWIAWTHRPIPTIVYTKQATAPAVFATLLYPYRGEVPRVSHTELSVQGAWATEVETPREKLVLLVKQAPDAALLVLPTTLLPGCRTDAQALIIRQPKAGKATPWVEAISATRLQAEGWGWQSKVPVSLVVLPPENGTLRLYNAGSEAAALTLTAPAMQAVSLPPGAWMLVTAAGATPLLTPPSLIF